MELVSQGFVGCCDIFAFSRGVDDEWLFGLDALLVSGCFLAYPYLELSLSSSVLGWNSFKN
jgi:hypothetical protein